MDSHVLKMFDAKESGSVPGTGGTIPCRQEGRPSVNTIHLGLFDDKNRKVGWRCGDKPYSARISRTDRVKSLFSTWALEVVPGVGSVSVNQPESI